MAGCFQQLIQRFCMASFAGRLQSDWALPSTVVIIDAGHGGIDGEPHQLIF